MSLWVIFLTGLTTGGLACLAVQGGLLTSVIANHKQQEIDSVADGVLNATNIGKLKKKLSNKAQYLRFFQGRINLETFDQLDWLPVSMFLGAKLVAHAVLGLFLGFLGERITLSLEFRLLFQVFTAFFMFTTAMNLLQVHPIFRFVMFQPPKFIQRLVRGSSKSNALFAPAILGLLTIFVPCGVTQAMEVVAINSADPIQGALIMSSFVLGTTPLFAVIGIATARLSESWNDKFTKIASYLLIGMAIYSINGVLLVVNSPVSLQSLVRPINYFFSDDRFSSNKKSQVEIKNGVQKVTIEAENSGYSPRYFSVKLGVPVQLTVTTTDVYSCASAFVFKEFGISTFLKSTDSQTFTFTPTKKGKFTYSCSMGMYTGVMEVL